MGVKLARNRNTAYFVRCPLAGGEKQYTWARARNGKTDVHEVPQEVFDYLTLNSRCFDEGELEIVEESDEKLKELKGNLGDPESYENNTHKEDEIEKLLKGNFPKMKSALNAITSDSEKQFVISVAKKIASGLAKGKIDFLSQWMNVESDILFPPDGE